MRTGLLAAGAAVAVIGVGVLLASLTFSTGPPVSQFDAVSVSSLPGHAFYAQELGGANQSSAKIDLVWASSQFLAVSLYPSVSCPHLTGVCAGNSPVASWWGNSGRWSWTGTVSWPLFLNLSNPNGTAATFSGSLYETYTTNPLTNPTWNLFLPLIGAVVLIAIGGVAVFLGLFLPKGVYTGRGPPPEDDYLDEDDEDPGGRDIDSVSEDEGPPEEGHA